MTLDQLMVEAYACRSCPSAYGFSSASRGGPNFKFPPIIGCHQNPKVLFVGINPRRSSSNMVLHDKLMSDFGAFIELSQNRYQGAPYVVAAGNEEHYRFHSRIVAKLFGPATPFESVAAVSELYLCATESSKLLPKLPAAPCAEKFLLATIGALNPEFIVAVGGTVFDFFLGLSGSDRAKGTRMLINSTIKDQSFRVVGIPHPSNERLSDNEKDHLVSMAIELMMALRGA